LIKKIKIENFKGFEGIFELDLKDGLNILVGNNEAGKSTILEAIHLALTGLINGKYLNTELTQYLFNNAVVKRYIDSISNGSPISPPYVKIEIFFSNEEDLPLFIGNGNTEKSNACGISLAIEFDEKYKDEYEALLKIGSIKTLPMEYYESKWSTFARKDITTKSIPVKSALIDSVSTRYQNGSDVYISRIVRNILESEEIVEISQAHRQMRENFMGAAAIKNINSKLQEKAEISDKKIELSVELLSKNAWEGSLMTYLDEVPFHYIGKGEQCVVKTKLAFSDKRTKEAPIVLMEEPENHLTYARLNQLINYVKKECENRQVIISTHSGFVANKLGLSNLVLLNEKRTIRLTDLNDDTWGFFEKAAGYDTLRMLLSQKSILVEGASDELIIQRAYMDNHNGRLPIEDGIDVISVGTAFLRFLEIAEKICKCITVITDNDGDIPALEKKYTNYIGNQKKANILISFDCNYYRGDLKIGDTPYNYNTIENLVFLSNGLERMNAILGTTYATEDELRKFMKQNKTECALRIFGTIEQVKFPKYITNVVDEL